MSRPAAVSADQIRATVLAMLAEAGDAHPSAGAAAPVTRERFRRAVSVRRLRARLGAGDPAVLSRALNAIEAELVQAGLTQVALPGLPDEIAEQMRTLWAAAVSVQLDDVVRLKTEARDAMDSAETARHDAALRVELLRVELADLRTQISARDLELATARAECRAALGTLAEREQMAAALRQSAEQATRALDDARTDQAAALATVHARYEGLSKRLLQGRRNTSVTRSPPSASGSPPSWPTRRPASLRSRACASACWTRWPVGVMRTGRRRPKRRP